MGRLMRGVWAGLLLFGFLMVIFVSLVAVMFAVNAAFIYFGLDLGFLPGGITLLLLICIYFGWESQR